MEYSGTRFSDPLSYFPARLTPVRQAPRGKRVYMNYLITIKFRSPALRDKFHGDPDSAAYREQLNYN